jgi:uncharacterized protein YegP (UPF0339 family)
MDEENSYRALDVFEGEGGEWFWHVKSGNGQIVATGGEGYSSKAAAYRGYAAAAKVIVGLAARSAELESEAQAELAEKAAEGGDTA